MANARFRLGWRLTRTACVVFVAIGLGLAGLGCSWGHRSYKPDLPDAWQLPCKDYQNYFDAKDMALDERLSLASNICVEGGGLTIRMIEFDDEGTHWNRGQLQRLEQEIRAIGAAQASAAIPTDGILLLPFVHGWGNSGSEGSTALLDFRKVVRDIAGSSGICHPDWLPDEALGASCGSRPYVVAVYLAWHGDSLALNSIYAKTRTRRTDWLGALRLPTFWARKSAARRAGGTPMTETLLRLLNAVEDADRQRVAHKARREPDRKAPLARSRSIVIGHSLGAGIVEQAFAQMVIARHTERSLAPTGASSGEPLTNLLVLLNPATEALSAIHLIEAMQMYRVSCAAAPVRSRPPAPWIVSMASSKDSVTRSVFPGSLYVGRTLAMRPANRMRAETRFGDYGKLTTRTAAHHPSVQSHRLQRGTCNDGADAGIGLRTRDHSYRLCRRKEPAHDAPYWVFTVPPELLPNHRDIFTTELFEFLLALARYDADPTLRCDDSAK